MNDLGKDAVSRRTIEEESGGQRIDNYLVKILKGVPKSHIYRILRSGEVRVNSGRIGADYRLRAGDQLRLPPVRIARRDERPAPPINRKLREAVVYEDDHVLALDKPSGLAVHGGSGVNFGVIEQLRTLRPEARFLELVHRLDRDTSGVLLIAKKRSALTSLHEQLRSGGVKKHYLALVKGVWHNPRQNVHLKLRKYVVASGERRVSVDTGGQDAHTVFELQKRWQTCSLLRAELKTGRTHQIRVHLAHLDFPIAGDDKYGDPEFNKTLSRSGLKRMFLHAASVGFRHPSTGKALTITAPLPLALQKFLDAL
jgi:23S rRNA pseudouridine955/2504/2580 synthase